MDIIKEIEEKVEKGEEKLGIKPKKAKKTRPSVAELEKELSGEELVKEAEKESLGVDIEKKKKELLEKVAKLKGKIETVSAEELKEKVKGKKKGDMLVPLEEYVKSGIYLGTKVVTPQMKQYVDKNALNDTLNVHKKILMVCDTNNFPQGTNQIIIGNNKSARSLGLIFYLL